MLTSHSRNGSQAQQQLQQQQQQQQQHLEIQKKHAKAERVRKLWTEFEQWLQHPRNEMERVRVHLLLQTANLNSNTVKTSRRRVEEAHFFKAREEWQRRLRAVDLKESDWDPMNEAEMKAVEEALGVDDGEGYITDPSPSPPHRPFYAVASTSSAAATSLVPAENLANRSSSSLLPGPPMIVAPPMTSASRATSASSSSYECVRPEEFHSDDEESTSDSEFSFSTTISSIISEEDEVVGPVTEYMFTQAFESDPYLGVRPSMEVAKETNGPLLARTVPVPKPVDAGAGSQPPPSLAPPKRPPDARQQPQATTASRSSSKSSSASVSKKPSPLVPTQSAASKKPSPPVPTQSAASTKPSPPVLSQNAAPTTTKSSPPVASTSTASSSKSQQQSTKSSRVHYPLVAPSLSDLSDYDEVENDAESERLSPSLVAQFEAQFEVRKLEIRIVKIQQFHELASEADVALSISIADGRRDHTLSRQGEVDLVQRHYESTVALRDRMEKERKEQVNEEKKRMREEYIWHSSSSNQRHHGGFLQPQPPVESDSEDDQEDEMQKMMMERMRQELALQAQFSSHEPQKAQAMRRRPGTLMLDSVPTPTVAMNDKSFEEVSTPRAAPKGGAWSPAKPPATRTLANVLGQSLSRKPTSPLFEPVVLQQQQQSFIQEADDGELEADHEDADNEKERENTGFWSYLTSGSKKKAANAALPQSPQPQWNFPSPPQKPTTAKSRLGIVTSAWDDDLDADGKEPVEEVVAEKEVEKEELFQEKTPVIPLAPAPNVSPANKKQTKKQRQTNKKGAAPGAGPSLATTAKAEKVEVPPAPAPASSSSNAQKGPKTAPVGVPGKSGRKTLDNDDISSTPRPSVLKRLQAQMANEEMFNEQEDETPTTPRPPVVKKVAAAQAVNQWSRKTMNKNVVDPFDDDVAVDSTPGATSSRTMLDQANGKKMTEAVASSPQVPGGWSWGPTTVNDKAKAPAEAPSTTTVAGSRKNNGLARQAAVNGVDNTEPSKKKVKKAQRGGATNGASNSAWSTKKTTVEEIPDDEADDLHPGSQVDKLLPHNSRSILEEMRASPFDFEEQPRIHEPRPSKPRSVFENIIQYGEPTPDPGLVHDLRDELSWSEERIAQAVARMAQESAEMDRKVNGLNGLNGVNGLTGTNGYLPSPGPMSNGVAGMGMNGHVNMANMNRVNMTNMNGSVTAVNGFGLSKPATVAVDGATTTTKKQVRWQQQQQPQPQPSSFGGFDDHPRSQPLPPQAFVNKMASVSRSYEDDEAFSPLASTNGGFSGFQPSSSLSSSLSSSYAPFGGRNTKMNGLSQFGGLSGNHHPFGDVEPEGGDELDRAARSLLDNIHVSVSSQPRNKPGFSAV